MHSTDYAPVPGSELRRRRKALGAKQQDVAARLKLTRITVYRLEQRDEVPVLEARKYLEALAAIEAEAAGKPEAAAQ